MKFYIRRKKYCRHFLPGEGWFSHRNNFVLETSCHRKIFLSQEEFSVTGRSFKSQEEISCERKIFCHRKKFAVTGRNFPSICPTLCWILNCIGNVATSITIYTYDLELLHFGSHDSSPLMCLFDWNQECQKSCASNLIVNCPKIRHLGRSFGDEKILPGS